MMRLDTLPPENPNSKSNEKLNKKGWVCIVETNKTGHFRIMKTKKDPAVRANELFTNTEEDPNTLHKLHVSDCDAVKKEVCSTLSHRRVGRKDIFEVNLERAISLIDFAAEKYPVHDKKQEVNSHSGGSGDPFGALMLLAFFVAIIFIVIGLLNSLFFLAYLQWW